MMSIVDDNCVHIGNIQSRLDDGGCNQHIIFPFDEIIHHLLKFVPLHLTVGNSHFYPWNHALNHYRNIHDIQHSGCHKKDLATPRNLKCNGFLDHFLAKGVDFGLHRIAVWRRGINDGKIAGAHEREL